MVEDDESHVITPQLIWRVYHVPILLGLLSLLFIALSITIFIKSYQKMTPVTFSSDATEATVAGTISAKDATILVDIEGEVERPGVYRMQEGARIDDLIGFAGGFTAKADTDEIARLVNRAARMTDGAKIYIPRIRDTESSRYDTQPADATRFININTATAQELESLSGVGPVTSAAIISARPYQRTEELVEKKVMSRSVFEKLKDQLVL